MIQSPCRLILRRGGSKFFLDRKFILEHLFRLQRAECSSLLPDIQTLGNVCTPPEVWPTHPQA